MFLLASLMLFWSVNKNLLTENNDWKA